MGIITKGMGVILKGGKKKKILTADKGAIRIEQINKKLRNTPHHARQDIFEDHIDEVKAIYDKGKK